MCSKRPERPGRPRWRWLVWLLLLPMAGFGRDGGAPVVLEVPPADSPAEAWLITVAPGELYWQRFGHNAVWLREPARQLDHSFNFGYFDFQQEGFLARFVQGRMLYQSLAFPAREEFAVYAREGRSIRAQELDLSDAQYQRLREHLVWHVQPANRDYLYDYYLDNCSTRIRDALDLALDGDMSRRARAEPARLDFRGHTRRLTSMDFWYYLGLETVLGMPVDRSVSRWDEMFIPAVVAQTVGAMQNAGSGAALSSREAWIYRSGAQPPPSDPPAVWPRYLLLGLAMCGLAWLAGRRYPAVSLMLARSWVMLAALAGAVIAVLWAATDHQVVGPNLNLLLLNPLFLALLWRRFARVAAAVVLVAAAAAWWLAVVQQLQYSVDVLALALPLQAAAALRLASSSVRADQAGPAAGAGRIRAGAGRGR